uniref:Uncharacterized protein n=1 Tax=Anguilla anguilla TaxID=7936 RepID=A0A0E9XR13_ANGAN
MTQVLLQIWPTRSSQMITW